MTSSRTSPHRSVPFLGLLAFATAVTALGPAGTSTAAPGSDGHASASASEPDSVRPPVAGVGGHEPAGRQVNADGASVAADFGRLPLRFEPNVGQTGKAVNYLARGGGVTAWLTDREIVLALTPHQRRLPTAVNRDAAAGSAAATRVVRLRLEGADPNPVVRATGRLPGRSHYLLGDDPRGWRAEVPGYARVRYQDVWPGVDLVFHGTRGGLEYDVVVAPGADLSQVRLAVTGARTQLDRSGGLTLRTPGRDLHQQPPVLYQRGAAGKQRVTGGYVVSADGRVGFRVGAYDATRTLVVDPVLAYSTFLGGSGQDSIGAVVAGRRGSAYVAGFTDSIDLPTRGALQDGNAGGQDLFISKLARGGQRLVYSTYLGGSGDDTLGGIDLDAAGRVHVGAGTTSRDWPLVRPRQRRHQGGDYDGALATLSRSGDRLTYSSYLGGSGDEGVFDIAVGRDGSRYASGSTWSSDFPLRDPVQSTVVGLSDTFITKVGPRGQRLAYSTFYGGSFFDIVGGIAVDRHGAVRVAGWTESRDLLTRRAVQPRFGGGLTDGFVLGLGPLGRLGFATYLGGRDNENLESGIAIGRTGANYVAGWTASSDFPTVEPLQAEIAGDADAFVARLSSRGRRLAYSTFLGGSGSEGGLGVGGGVVVDRRGRMHLAGTTHSADFPLRHPVQRRLKGDEDGWVATLGAKGQQLRFASYLGGAREDAVTGLDTGPRRSLYVVGGTTSSDFPVVRPLQQSRRGVVDGFITRLRFDRSP